MSLVITQRSQPSWPNGFARSRGQSANPGLLRRLRIGWCPSLGVQGRKLFNVVSGGPDIPFHVNLANSAWNTGDGVGAYLRGDGTAGDKLTTTTAPLQDAFEQYTILVRCRAASYPGSFFGIFGRNEEAAAGQISIQTGNADNEFRFRVVGSVAAVNSDFAHAPAFANVWTSVAGVRRASNDHALYVAGLERTINTTETGNIGASGNEWQVLSREEAEFIGDVAECWFWDRALTDAELMLMHIDPLAPLRKRIILPLGSVAPAAPTDGIARLIFLTGEMA